MKEEGLTTAVGTTYVLKYYYDSMDRVTKMVYPTSEQVQTTYNAMGLPATLYSLTLDRQYVTGASYTAAGALASLTLLNGTRTEYTYYDEPGVDQSQRLRQLAVTTDGTPLLDLTYSYDAVSNLTGLTDATPGREERLTLAYDAFNRLTAVSGGSSASYTYDRLDRLTSVTEGSDSTIFGTWSAGTATNTPGQPRHAPRYIGNPSNQFGYDPAGNMTLRWLKQGGSYTAYTQKFNVDNRLSQVSGTGTTTTYDLDAHTGTTLRRTQTSGGTTTVTDFVLRYYQKNVTAGTGTVSYYFGDRLVAQLSTKRTFLHGDHLGSTVLVTDGAGAVLARYRYHAYGRQREGSSLTERRFTGQRWESSTFLYDYQARHYDPALSLFVSPDPIVPEPGRPAALNRFAYTFGNPVKYVDPSGYDPLDAAWRQAFYDAHGHWPTDQDMRARLFSLLFAGHGKNGEWTDEDWAFYTQHGDRLWAGIQPWPGAEAPSLGRFISHLDKLASYYNPGEEALFVMDAGAIWAGMPPRINPWGQQAAMFVARAWAAERYEPLYEGNTNWKPELVDDQNPSVHFMAFFHMGYFTNRYTGSAINAVREAASTRGRSWEDFHLGNVAAKYGGMLADGIIRKGEVGMALRYALDARPGLWPANTPGARSPNWWP